MTVFVDKIAKWTAIFGGLVLMGLILLAVVSIVGRSINTLSFLPGMVEAIPAFSQLVETIGITGVSGDFEMIEAGVAFAIFSFLPYCQLHGGHASVDIFTSFLPRTVNRYIVAFWDVVLALVICLICWQNPRSQHRKPFSKAWRNPSLKWHSRTVVTRASSTRIPCWNPWKLRTFILNTNAAKATVAVVGCVL